jgi:hypothetical protein
MCSMERCSLPIRRTGIITEFGAVAVLPARPPTKYMRKRMDKSPRVFDYFLMRSES